MPLSAPTARERLHLRRITYEGYRRADDLFDIEARLIDTKDHPYRLATGERAPHQPVHEMLVRVTIDRDFNVVAIEASTEAMPYPGECDKITPAYGKLVGANLLRGFRKTVAERLGGVLGCTHLSELLAFLPTAAVQTFAGLRPETEGWGERKPFQLDGCHALSTEGELVRRYYPKWYVGPSGKMQAINESESGGRSA
ncbi:MAG: DUF2889 domain-containing protein [Casimicrobiaceae bacterium]|nr:DUF2889 domain-containing protein [Casimicrobiaceae bacterium]MCX8097675.1 DUF2889 domain-containing protein [Casimicrobiaceae bacterium]MDW8312268.1 DUF2889 domain-containing protein [Burkholderiales bacterium]